MNNENSLFETSENQNIFVPKINVTNVDFKNAQTMSYNDLFDGYNKLYAITYSYGLQFVSKIIKKFDYAEIIFGNEKLVKDSLNMIFAIQSKIIEKIHEKYPELSKRTANNTLQVKMAREELSHEKTYILLADDGRTRVIIGSGNMSQTAFFGKQRENFCVMDNIEAYNYYIEQFRTYWNNCSDTLSSKTLLEADITAIKNVGKLPITQSIQIAKLGLPIELPTSEQKEEIQFVYDIQELKKQYAQITPQPSNEDIKKGTTLIIPKHVESIKNNAIKADNALKEANIVRQAPRLIIDVTNQSISLNEKLLDLQPTKEEVAHDIELFMKCMDGYKIFEGDVKKLQTDYFKFANWVFVSPFLPQIRHAATLQKHNLTRYPIVGIMYGAAAAGKTTFSQILTTMMIGQCPSIGSKQIKMDAIQALRQGAKGAPIIIDDMDKGKFSRLASELIKDDVSAKDIESIHDSSLIISANKLSSIKPEYVRRIVRCYVQATLPNKNILKDTTNLTKMILDEIKTGFYREYSRIILEKMPEILNQFRLTKINTSAPDILAINSQVLCELIEKHINEPLPDYIRTFTIFDYLDEKDIALDAIEIITTLWNTSQDDFTINKKENLLFLKTNTGQYNQGTSTIITDGLPAHIEARDHGQTVRMNLKELSKFTGLDFSERKSWFRKKTKCANYI